MDMNYRVMDKEKYYRLTQIEQQWDLLLIHSANSRILIPDRM